ncbi:hypothetical protein BSY19_4868 (plasmid) [Bosea sp. RAC05]|nr:hypothetical protein BSY19_4868 [Bosea sp. RAC05]
MSDAALSSPWIDEFLKELETGAGEGDQVFLRTWPVRHWHGLGVKTGIAKCSHCGFSAKAAIRFAGPKGPPTCEPCFAHDNPEAARAWGLVHAWIPEIGQKEISQMVRTAQIMLWLKPSSDLSAQAKSLLSLVEARGRTLKSALQGRDWASAIQTLPQELVAEIAPSVRTIVLNVDPMEVVSWVESGGTFGGFRVVEKSR